ncbi:hypothetical protein L596_011837 [Steinernema carpocapsae]|uniref:Uncharacterized protein n=1 Tax=Steinernema carpocapsae TaxID=34508 RepID=A0A4U5NV73_STECR|nr:hypothetical protein L596_011837 [Steinernema carpocapsae]
MFREAVLLALLLSADALICHIYEQDLEGDSIDVDKNPLGVILATDCEQCAALKAEGKVKFGCVKDGYTSQLLGINKKPECPPGPYGSYNVMSNEEIYCCKGEFCYDRLRNQFSKSKSSRENYKCPVYRLLLNTDGSLSNKDLNDNAKFTRETCALCSTQKDSTGIEFQCTEHGQVDKTCSSKDTFPGGALACDSSRKDCCCKYASFSPSWLPSRPISDIRQSQLDKFFS